MRGSGSLLGKITYIQIISVFQWSTPAVTSVAFKLRPSASCRVSTTFPAKVRELAYRCTYVQELYRSVWNYN